ncbi:MAG: hypothetical protein AAGC88_12385, partial [Bacteroidota bacterium]
MNYYESIYRQDFNSLIHLLTDDATLNLQSVGTGTKADAQDLFQKQYDYLKDEIKEIKVFHRFEDDR